MHSNYKMKLHLIIKKVVSKKRAPIVAAVFHALSNKKKIFDIMSYYSRIFWGRRLSNPHFEKNAKQVFEISDFHSSQ
jgi:hypothetical protein